MTNQKSRDDKLRTMPRKGPALRRLFLRLLACPRFGCRNAFTNRRVRVEEPLNELVRLALGKILIGELLHRADKRRDGGRILPRVSVCLALMVARDRI